MESTVGCSLLVLLITFVLDSRFSQSCAIFEFPTLNGSTLTAKENSIIILPFNINTDPSCNLSDDVTIRVKVLDDGEHVGDFCSIRHFSGSCYAPSGLENGCECKNGTGFYQLKKTADRIDSTRWRFTNDGGMVQDKELTFNILYPATVKRVTLMSDDNETLSLPVEPGSSVDVGCYWQHGNPPTAAKLFDRHGVEMEGSIYSSGQIRYRFPAVGCQDAGLIRCEAPEASHNQSVTLLVNCVPEFDTGNLTNLTFSLEQSLEMEFHVRTFTTDMTDCQMVQKAGLIELRILLRSSARDKGSGFCNLTGTPPDLTLTVRVNNLTEQEAGKWQLRVTNDAGTGHLDLLILLPDDYRNVLNEKKPESQTDASQIPIHWITIGSVVGAVGLVGCVCLSIVMACRRKGGKEINPPMDVKLDGQDIGSSRITEHDPPVAGPSGVQGRPVSERCRESGVYWEIEDVDLLSQGDPEGAHDDYLHAVPTASDVYERPAQPDYLHAVPAASDIYERPAQPEYSHLNLLYEPLRNVYDNLALRVRRILRN